MTFQTLVLIIGLIAATLSLNAKAQSFPQTRWHAQNALVEQTYRALKAGKLNTAVKKGHALLDKRHPYRDRSGNRHLRYHGATSLCIAYRLANETKLAARFCTMAIELRPTNWRGYINRAALFIMTGDHKQALDDLERARKYGAPSGIIRENTQIARQAERDAFAMADRQRNRAATGDRDND